MQHVVAIELHGKTGSRERRRERDEIVMIPFWLILYEDDTFFYKYINFRNMSVKKRNPRVMAEKYMNLASRSRPSDSLSLEVNESEGIHSTFAKELTQGFRSLHFGIPESTCILKLRGYAVQVKSRPCLPDWSNEMGRRSVHLFCINNTTLEDKTRIFGYSISI